MRSRPFTATGTVLALTVILVAGCTQTLEAASTQQPTRAAWEPPASYAFVYETSCGERQHIGPARVTVRDGAVVDAEVLPVGRDVVGRVTTDDVLTLQGLLDLAEGAREDGADVVDLEVDPVDGHPTSLSIDWLEAAVDDEACYTVSGYEVLPGRTG